MDKEKKEIFEDHMINEYLKCHLKNVLNSKEVQDFQKGQDYKSKVGKDRDQKVFDLLVKTADMYLQGWVKSNALKTIELYRKNELIDDMAKEIAEIRNEMNGFINDFIVTLKKADVLTDLQLKRLRELEIEYRKI